MPSAPTGKPKPPCLGAACFRMKLLRLLLAVIRQNPIASLRELGTILLQAVQDDQVGLIHHRSAIFLHVVRAGLLLLRRSAVLLLLSNRPAGDRQRQQSGYQERFT